MADAFLAARQLRKARRVNMAGSLLLSFIFGGFIASLCIGEQAVELGVNLLGDGLEVLGV